MRANGCRDTDRAKNNRKRNRNGGVMHFLGGHGTHKKTVSYDGALVTHQKMHTTLWMGAHGPAWVWADNMSSVERKTTTKKT